MRRMLIWYLAQKFLLPGVVKGKKNVYVWPKCHAALRFQRFHIMSEGVHSFGSRATCMGFPGGARGKEPVYQCRRRMTHRFNPCVGKIPWRRAWQRTPVFLLGESHGQRSLEGYKSMGMQSQIQLKWLSTRSVKASIIPYLHEIYLTPSREKANVTVLQASRRLPCLNHTLWECRARINHQADHRPHWEPETDGLAPLHVHLRHLGNINWVPIVLGAGEIEADPQTENPEHRLNHLPLQSSPEDVGSRGRESDESRVTQPRPAVKSRKKPHYTYP